MEVILLLPLDLCDFLFQFLILNLTTKILLMKMNFMKTERLGSLVEVAGYQDLLNLKAQQNPLQTLSVYFI